MRTIAILMLVLVGAAIYVTVGAVQANRARPTCLALGYHEGIADLIGWRRGCVKYTLEGRETVYLDELPK